MTWYDAAQYCSDTFGVLADFDEGFFICVECGEPLYEDEYKHHNFQTCPICRVDFKRL